MKLSKPIVIGIGDSQKTISEINIKKEDFTARVIVEAEKKFLLSGGGFAKGEMESTRAYLGYVAAKIIDCKPEDLMKLTGTEYIKITNMIKGFFDGSDLETLMEILSGKSE